DTSDWLHRIAFERVADKLAQNLMEVRAQKYVYTEPRPGLGGVRPLPPHHWISDEEAHGVWALEQYLGYGVVGDQERPAGLRLVEWVRGYCALIILARETGRSGLVRTKAGWQDFFASFGLAAEASAILINIL
ncbi:hypothetical protein, partial [Raoultella terrigena]|uniref:hypothetical protein n=1 Tax=Raoultella terrigena TaxID=577 RepID=UPI001C70A783